MIGRLIGELQESCSVGVIYLRARSESPIEEALAQRCAVVEEVPRRVQPSRWITSASALARGEPMWVREWRVPAFRTRLRELLLRWNPDVVQFECHTMAQYADEVDSYPSILVEHEPGTPAIRDRWRTSRGWRRAVFARDAQSWQAYERRILTKFDAVVCFTELDKRQVLELEPNARIQVIPPAPPNAQISESIVRTGSSAPPPTIVFAGNFIHPPNLDAAHWLIGDIFPRVLLRHPDAELQIVGAGPPASLRRLASGLRVSITGTVPDVRPFLQSATVVVAPLRTGGGIRLKVMEALAYGKALVATPLAAEGLGVSDGRELLLAGTSESFAGRLADALSDQGLRQELSRNALAWAAIFGAPGRVGSAFEQLYAMLADRNRKRLESDRRFAS